MRIKPLPMSKMPLRRATVSLTRWLASSSHRRTCVLTESHESDARDDARRHTKAMTRMRQRRALTAREAWEARPSLPLRPQSFDKNVS